MEYLRDSALLGTSPLLDGITDERINIHQYRQAWKITKSRVGKQHIQT